MGKGQKLETHPGRNRNGQLKATDILAGDEEKAYRNKMQLLSISVEKNF